MLDKNGDGKETSSRPHDGGDAVQRDSGTQPPHPTAGRRRYNEI